MMKFFSRFLVCFALLAGKPAGAALDSWSTSNYIETTSGVITAAPVTMCAWINPTSVAANQNPMGIFASGSAVGAASFYIQVRATGAVRAVTNASFAETATGLVTTNTWAHVCAVFTSATSRAIFVNGANKATDTASATPASLNRMSIGLQRGSSPGTAFAGSIAEAAFWNVALSDDEVASLGKGMSPKLIRPAALVVYLPMVRDGVRAVKPGGSAVTGTLGVTVHAPIRGD